MGVILSNTIEEQLTLSDAHFSLTLEYVTDAVAMLGENTINGIYLSTLLEFLECAEIFKLSGEIWECWALNSNGFHPSIYSGFDFNSYCVLDDVTYGANEDGIYSLTGETDDGAVIHSGVIFAPTAYAGTHKTRFRRGIFDVEGSTPIFCAEADGQVVAAPIIHDKVAIPRSLIGKKWTFFIADFDKLGMVELFPIITVR